jgi:hypothetical protein
MSFMPPDRPPFTRVERIQSWFGNLRALRWATGDNRRAARMLEQHLADRSRLQSHDRPALFTQPGAAGAISTPDNPGLDPRIAPVSYWLPLEEGIAESDRLGIPVPRRARRAARRARRAG